ncbi:MAG: hypothetical protein FLDDKLPJ_00207 [Phycisphaerae bacterium]|nr:hypothetical protein [Phycisphaerae bacterium]
MAGGQFAKRIAFYTEPNWFPMGDGMDSSVFSIVNWSDALGDWIYAGGTFRIADKEDALGIAKWDGNRWTQVGGGVSGGRVFSLCVFDDGITRYVYVGGDFADAGGRPFPRLARWNGQEWSSTDRSPPNGPVHSMIVHDDGTGPNLYITGTFTDMAQMKVNSIARWDGEHWHTLGTGLTRDGRAALGLTLAGLRYGRDGRPSLIVAGRFDHAGEAAANNIAEWDGAQWHALDEGLDPWDVRSLSVFDSGDGQGPLLFAGGDFTTAGRDEAHHLARWDGRAWFPLGSGSDQEVYAMTTVQFPEERRQSLMIGGGFSSADGVAVHGAIELEGCPIPACEDIRKFDVRCRSRRIKVTIMIADASKVGEFLTLMVDGHRFPLEIKARFVELSVRGARGAHWVELISPGNCGIAKSVDCP